MTPPIGFRTGSHCDSHSATAARSALMEIRPVGITDAAFSSLAAPSPVADYAYRIAAVTAGLALIATFI
jgi:hypothetical protein